jgi:hypothetical protein
MSIVMVIARYRRRKRRSKLSQWLLCACAVPLLAAADQPRKTVQPMPVQIPPQMLIALPGPAPSILGLTPVSATNLAIAWTSVPGAIRYVLIRDGAANTTIDSNAGFLQGNQFHYTDVGRKPATIYTYSVEAQFPAPAHPGRSAPMRILMPTAFAPANFRATVSGPNTVSLVWSGRPEATGYRVVRNGGNLPAVSFDVSGNSFVDSNAPAGGQYSYVVCSLMKLASGEIYGGEFSAPATVKTRPFNVLAVGDSVMWGQGLRTADKFASKVTAWIGAQLGVQAAPLSMKAHSGAVTYIDPGTPDYDNRSYDGEVPSSFPTIAHQIDLASSPSVANPFAAADVDLVLVDGCANNLGITTVLNPFGDDGSLHTQTQAYCNDGMSNILMKVVQAFPNADVIVTGYFRFVTDQSDLAALIPVFSIIGAAIPPDPLIGGVLVTQGFKARATARSDIFYVESNSGLQNAVAYANNQPFPGRTRFNQIHFAPLNPGPQNAYASPSTWMWLIPTPPLVQDDVYVARANACIQVSNAVSGNPNLLPGATQLCVVASMGHPNVAGAQAFTEAIKSVATPLIPQWRAARLGPVGAPADTIVVSVQLGAEDASGAPITVAAVDGASGAPLPGRVLFYGVDAGALGAPLHYTYAAANPVDIQAAVQVPGRNPRYFTIPVRTFSVSLTVANSATVATAIDNLTGRALSGTVTLNANSPSAVTVPTGQPMSFSLCAPASGFHPDHPLPGQPQCGGVVHVPYYPDVRY